MVGRRVEKSGERLGFLKVESLEFQLVVKWADSMVDWSGNRLVGPLVGRKERN